MLKTNIVTLVLRECPSCSAFIYTCVVHSISIDFCGVFPSLLLLHFPLGLSSTFDPAAYLPRNFPALPCPWVLLAFIKNGKHRLHLHNHLHFIFDLAVLLYSSFSSSKDSIHIVVVCTCLSFFWCLKYHMRFISRFGEEKWKVSYTDFRSQVQRRYSTPPPFHS